ncbi:MAG: UbiA family prenyltransferase [Deltaproteobacteria bacterium]|nr:UbiA family prenyltransferase [Deltaproteobacteria bacterium]
MSISALSAGAATVARPTDVVLAWRTLRAPQWLHFAVLPALPLYALLRTAPLEALARFAPGAVVAALSLAFAYGINAIADRHGDRDVAKNPLAGLAQAPALAWWAVLGCAALALAVAALGAPWLRLDCTAISLVAGTLYSVGPRVKSLPVVGTLTNAVIFAPLALVVRLEGASPPHMALLLCAFVVLQTQTQLVHEAGDLAEDESSGISSSAVIFGPRAAMNAARILGYVGAFSFVAGFGLARMPVIASAATILGGALIGRASPERASEVRHAHRRLSLAAGAMLFALAVSDAVAPIP